MTSSFCKPGSTAMPAAAESIPLLELLQGVQDPSARVMCEDMLKQDEDVYVRVHLHSLVRYDDYSYDSQLEAREGYCFEMLKIASQENVVLASRQLAAIQLKNIVKRRWRPSTAGQKKGIQPIPEQDKKEIMANIHECVVRSPREVQAQLLEVVREIASNDYPNPWSNILPECLASLAGGEPSRVYGSLLVLRKVASSIEFASHHGQSMQEFSSAALPALAQVMLRLLVEAPSEHLAILQRVTVKIFWSCVYMSIPDCLTKHQDLARHWLQVLLKMMQQPMPASATVAGVQDQEKSAWWLLRKWLLRVAYRLVDRYGDPKIIKIETAQPFASLFLAEFSNYYLQCILQYAKNIGEGQWASRQSITYTCRYLQTAAKQSATQEYLKPYLFDMLVHVAMPLTFFNRELHEEWTEDPMEVIRRNSAALIMVTTDDLYDPRDASVSLIRDIMKTKALSQALLEPFMKAVLQVLVDFKQCDPAANPAQYTELAYKTDGVLLILGALLDSVLVRHKSYKDGLQSIAQEHILPLFASPYPFLRAKAAWLAGVFVGEVECSTGDGSRKKGHGELFDQLFDCVLRCMKDTDLPVQVEAVNAFRDFVEQLGEAGRLVAKLEPILQDLLRHFFQMASHVEAMDVIMAVDTIIERVGDAIQPYAVQCARELIAVYARVVNESDGDLDSEKLFDQGYHILAPIIKLLDACSNIPSILAAFEELLEPLIRDICSRDTEALFEQICEILGYFTYFASPLSQRLWAFWPMLEGFLCTTGWGIEYTENIIVPLDNFICRGTDVFCSSTAPNYRESVFRMAKHCFNLSNAEVCDMEKELKPITKLLDIVLLNCRGRVDEWVWPYIEICMNRITTAKDPGFGTLLMNVVAAALLYNAELTLQALEANGRTTQMIKTEDQYFRRLYDKKLCCAGLLCIFNLPSTAVPSAISGALDKVLPEVVKMLRRLKEQEEAAKDAKESDNSEEEDSSDAATGDMGSHIDPADEDAAYDEMLAERRTLLAKLEGGEADDDDDDLEGFLNGDWTDDEEIETALNNVDVFNMLVAAMNSMKSNEPERFQAMMESVGDVVKKNMHDLGNYALIRNADQAHNAANV